MNLTKKQQVLSVATLIVFLLIIWQVYTMMSTPSAGSAPASASKTPGMPAAEMPVTVAVSEKMPHAAEAGASQLEQDAYLRLASEYQMIQMQRMIAEGYAAIAAARLNAAKALSELNKYNVETGPSALSGFSEGKGEYELIYLGQQGGEWGATLKKGSQTFDVTAGTVLGKGARVLQVDGDGVVVMKNNKKILVTFNGDMPVTEEEPEQENAVEAAETKELNVPEKKTAAKKPVPTPVVPTPVSTTATAQQDLETKKLEAQKIAVEAKLAEAQAKLAKAEEKLAAAAKKTAPVAPVPATQPKPAPVTEMKKTVPVPAPQPQPAPVTEVKKTLPPPPVPAMPQPVAVTKPAPAASQPTSAVPQPVAAAKQVQVPEIKPVNTAMPQIHIALQSKGLPEAKKSPETAKSETAAPITKQVTKLATEIKKDVKQAEKEVQKEVKKVESAVQQQPAKPKPTPAEQAELQQLQALLPPDQAKKMTGNANNAKKPTTTTAQASIPSLTMPSASAAKQQTQTPTKATEQVLPAKQTLAKAAEQVQQAEQTMLAKPTNEKPTLALASGTAVAKPEKALEEKPKAPEEKPVAQSSSNPSSSEAYLLGVSPDSYTIQMIANTEPSSLFNFIKAQQLDTKAMWYRTTRNGGPWCVLIYGEYPDLASAKQALAALPASTRAWSPFIRKMSVVQSAIQQGPAKGTTPQAQPLVQTVQEIKKPSAVEKPIKPAPTPAPEIKKPASVAAIPVSMPEIKKPAPVAPSMPAIEIKKAESAVMAPTVTPAPTPEAKPQATPQANKPQPATNTSLSSEKHLIGANPNTYTIQLTANANLDTVVKYVRDNKLDKNAMWYRTTRDGKDWYVLVYGEYVDMDAAKKAFSELPTNMQASAPFIRQMSSVQAALKRKGG